jgi:hypothetical protein
VAAGRHRRLAGAVGRRAPAALPRAQNLEGEGRQARRCSLGVGQQGIHVLGRALVEVVLAGLQKPLEMGVAEAESLHRLGEGGHEVVARRRAGIDVPDRLAPPLEADQSEHGFGHGLGDHGDLEVEGVEREQGLAAGLRREQGAQEAVVVEAANLVGGERQRSRRGHGATIHAWPPVGARTRSGTGHKESVL